ncbi:hypothetical protein A8L34_22420 [Bacillus sp. FJAT-27264]|uniref:hypothetical protein n=1 Tax=Paenibacillus sp. (strain DSM 101736 / FJAT-27264) TaxID=1850362 RepID=UPI0008080849|nr:hypothetical protein [Bacillus sp. FJAT-27264]OBZ08911.1 hypothetical protein A8L34_22420 [Bacillus sp. FJAT-27264]
MSEGSSSLRPERIESIKERLTEKQARVGYIERAETEVMEVLAALEEAQQRIVKLERYVKALEFSRDTAQKHADSIAKEKGLELYEAQQIIDRHEREAERKQQFVVEQAEYVNEIEIDLRKTQQTIASKDDTIAMLMGQITDEVALHAKTAAALIRAEQTIEELNIALDLSIEETNKWSTLANSAAADNERLRQLLDERGIIDPEASESDE